MSTLLDSNVLSEQRKPRPNESVMRFLSQLSAAETMISVNTLGELAYGVARLPNGGRGTRLATWLEGIVLEYGDRVISPDVVTAQIWGELQARSISLGRPLHVGDCWIAATALRHGLRLATRKVRDFQPTGVMLVDPWNP